MKELLENREFNGAINIVSGQPVSSQQFAKALSGAIKRPALPRIPARAVRVMFGEVADAALLVGAEVKSERMSELGIKLQHTDIQECLTDIM